MDTDSVDDDGNSVSYGYAWSIDGVVDGSYITDTVSASDTTAGEVWECTVTPNDGTEDGIISTDSVTISSGCGLTNCDTTLDLGGDQSIDMVFCEEGRGRCYVQSAALPSLLHTKMAPNVLRA